MLFLAHSDNVFLWLQAHNLLTELVPKTFVGLESLLSLDLSANKLHTFHSRELPASEHIGQVFRDTPKLLTLNLGGNALGDEAGVCASSNNNTDDDGGYDDESRRWRQAASLCRTPTRNFTFAPSNRLCIEVVTGIEKGDAGFLNL